MAAQVVLLRGINLGPQRRIAMPALREALTGAGFTGVRTYVQSGNVVLGAGSTGEALGAEVAALILERFGLEVPVLTRTAAELARVVERNPFPEAADDPKRYQVAFLGEELEPELVERLSATASAQESFAAIGRELYAWHAVGVARSKLWNAIAGWRLGTTVTARNWTTVTTLLEMANETDAD